MQKVLFLDRDGTLVVEPPIDKQLDSLEKLEYMPMVFSSLSKIAQELDFIFVMVTNQDGLGTESFPEESFWPAQNKIIQAFQREGIEFSDVLIDKSFEEENKETRKPGTGLLNKYIHGSYDLENSFVIGDRASDIQLAKNLGCQGIFIGDTNAEAALSTQNWQEIYQFLKSKPRRAKILRKTNETKVSVDLNLDGTGRSSISTGLNFLDHMLEQIAKHGQIDLSVEVDGDLQVDEHHTVEDTAIVLGGAFKKALGTKKGVMRYGFVLPMDDCQSKVTIDFGGRPWFIWKVKFKREKIGDVPTELFSHFFKSFSDAAACNLHIKAKGKNEHHKIESIFKAFAKAVFMAKERVSNNIPSTKGSV